MQISETMDPWELAHEVGLENDEQGERLRLLLLAKGLRGKDTGDLSGEQMGDLCLQAMLAKEDRIVP